MSVLTKEMVVAAQRVAFTAAAEAFRNNPTSTAWRGLEIEMWAWQALKQTDEAALLELLIPVGVGNWSMALEDKARSKAR